PALHEVHYDRLPGTGGVVSLANKLKIKKGDLVQVIAGARESRGGDRGKQGKVLADYPERNRVLVEGVNRVLKHKKATQTQAGGNAGGRETHEAPIHVSNMALLDLNDNQPTSDTYS